MLAEMMNMSVELQQSQVSGGVREI